MGFLTAATVKKLEFQESKIAAGSHFDKKLSYRRGTELCVVSIEILPTVMQQCRNYLYDKS